jgi:hypothetical protein
MWRLHDVLFNEHECACHGLYDIGIVTGAARISDLVLMREFEHVDMDV